jgi:putative tryptophan/tyrosine transport system substrate-binding protein
MMLDNRLEGARELVPITMLIQQYLEPSKVGCKIRFPAVGTGNGGYRNLVDVLGSAAHSSGTMDRPTRREFLRGSLAAAAAGLLAGCGLVSRPSQQAVRTPRIGYVWTGGQEWADAFREGLAELGYVEGSTVTVEWRPADGQVDRAPELAAELVSMPVDVLVASGANFIREAMRATSTIPIVMAQTNDPVADGFVASLARPGGNVTGQTGIGRELIGKRLEVLRKALPSVSRVGVIWNPALPTAAAQLQLAEAAAGPLGQILVPLEVREPADMEGAFERAVQERVDTLVPLDSAVLNSNVERVGGLALSHRLPMIWITRESVAAGGLIAYGANRPALERRAAIYVDKILKGANPAELPVERPEKFDLVINLTTAQALGLTIPQSVLAEATEIIQ